MPDSWTERDKAQIEQVFGLTGGELMDEPWVEKDENDQEWTSHFWYEFPPTYADRGKTPDGDALIDSTAHSYRTMVRDIMFGPPPERLADWRRVATFHTSGETECPGRNEDDKTVRADQCNDGTNCWYCEEPIGKEHSHIYLGDGWAEIVYAQIQPIARLVTYVVLTTSENDEPENWRDLVGDGSADLYEEEQVDFDQFAKENERP